MQYYIETIEQINSEGTIAEYGNTEKVATYESALSKFYKKLSDVSAALGKSHYYMDIKIVNSKGGIEKKDSLGAYQEPAPVEE